MHDNCWGRALVKLSAALIFSVALPGVSLCNEFRPYNLPGASSERPPSAKQNVQPESGKVIDEQVYSQFARDAEKMTPEKKAELIKYFTSKRDQAAQFQEFKHYSRLLEILEKK